MQELQIVSWSRASLKDLQTQTHPRDLDSKIPSFPYLRMHPDYVYQSEKNNTTFFVICGHFCQEKFYNICHSHSFVCLTAPMDDPIFRTLRGAALKCEVTFSLLPNCICVGFLTNTGLREGTHEAVESRDATLVRQL